MEALRKRLRHPLPGPAAWAEFSVRKSHDSFRPPPDGFRQAAVLICLFPEHEALRLPLMLRPGRAGPHSGQISLPGGAFEPERDAGLLDTALREAEEEMGIRARDLEILGGLTPLYIPVSRFFVHPFVARASRRPDFHPDPVEVERIIEVELEDLRREEARSHAILSHQGRDFRAPCFRVNQGEIIWGATAMILAEFLAVLEEAEPQTENS